MQPDYPRKIVLKLQVDCMKMRSSTPIFLHRKQKNEKEPNIV